MKKNIIMLDVSDKSWIHDAEKFTEDEIKAINEVEYSFMKNLFKVFALAVLFMALAHHFKL